MNVLIVKDYEAMSAKAFEVLKEVVVTSNPCAVLGLATGSTVLGLTKTW